MVNTLGEAKLNMKLNWATGTNWFYHAISLYTAPTEVVIEPINPLCLIIFWGTSRIESYIYIDLIFPLFSSFFAGSTPICTLRLQSILPTVPRPSPSCGAVLRYVGGYM